jgi:hypothetical protein
MPFSGHRWIGPPSCAWEDKHGHAATYSSAVDASRIRRSDATGLRRRHGSGHCVWRQKLRNNPGDCLVGMGSVGEGQGRVIRSSIHGTTILYMDVADQPYTPRALRWQS